MSERKYKIIALIMTTLLLLVIIVLAKVYSDGVNASAALAALSKANVSVKEKDASAIKELKDLMAIKDKELAGMTNEWKSGQLEFKQAKEELSLLKTEMSVLDKRAVDLNEQLYGFKKELAVKKDALSLCENKVNSLSSLNTEFDAVKKELANTKNALKSA
ncbi:MAG: hypothetical protein WCI27_09045, partial [Candidatus Omnitrophota bacterium]